MSLVFDRDGAICRLTTPLNKATASPTLPSSTVFTDWNTIYSNNLNSAFRKLRPDPHVLFPGDLLYIPDKKVKSESCQTAKVHTFRLTRKATRLRLVVRDIDGVPLGAKKYKLKVAGAAYDGVLADDALLNQPFPPTRWRES